MAWYDQLLQMGAVPAGAKPRSIDPYGQTVSSPVETMLRFYREQEELQRQRAEEARQRSEEKRRQEQHEAQMEAYANQNKYGSSSSGTTYAKAPKTSGNVAEMFDTSKQSQKSLDEKLQTYNALRSAGYDAERAYEATLKDTGLGVPGGTTKEEKAQAEIEKLKKQTEEIGKPKGLTPLQEKTLEGGKTIVKTRIQKIIQDPSATETTAAEIWSRATDGLTPSTIPSPDDPEIQKLLAEAERQQKIKLQGGQKEEDSSWWKKFSDFASPIVGTSVSAALAMKSKPKDYTGSVSSGLKYKVTKT